MNETIFSVISVLYLVSLALIDGLFNRLIFRDSRTCSYSSEDKKEIYKQWEWKAIGVIFLVFLPIILPSLISYLIGGVSLMVLYWAILLLVPWDMFFGALVFDDWFGDTPSIALPIVGWVSVPLLTTMIVRVSLAVLLIRF
jgi:hypothetical protein